MRFVLSCCRRVMEFQMPLWTIAKVAWLATLVSFLVPGVASANIVEVADMRFSFGEVGTLVAIGFAWGDMRQWRAEVEKRLAKLED